VVQEREKITQALQQSESELKEALSKEKELGNLKSRFVSMASHEFRTPLSSILSSAELIEMILKKGQPEKAATYLNRIAGSVEALTGILNEFLSLSKLDEGESVAAHTKINLIAFCDRLIDEFLPLLKKGQEIIKEHASKEIFIHGDERMLKHILTNLLSNASKYSEVDKSIICQIVQKDKIVELSIQDKGMGIPKEDIEHLFTRFFRASNVTNIDGTGLGLHITKRYLELMGGTISLESILDVGSTFKITLPIK